MTSLVSTDALTPEEQALYDKLPRPPITAQVCVTNIWVVEWLPAVDRRTGHELYEWLNQRRPRWAHYIRCETGRDVVEGIESASRRAAATGMRPVLHIEAHGDENGLWGPGIGADRFLAWKTLYEPLARLNFETRCNLLVCVAACKGFGLVNAFGSGPRAAAAAIIGPGGDVVERDLLSAAKELYRRQLDTAPDLTEMTISASREMSNASFEVQSFAPMAHEAYLQRLIVSMRPSELSATASRIRRRLVYEVGLSPEEADRRVSQSPKLPPADALQGVWDALFMIDVEPRNASRFGVDMSVVRRILLGDE